MNISHNPFCKPGVQPAFGTNFTHIARDKIAGIIAQTENPTEAILELEEIRDFRRGKEDEPTIKVNGSVTADNLLTLVFKDESRSIEIGNRRFPTLEDVKSTFITMNPYENPYEKARAIMSDEVQD